MSLLDDIERIRNEAECIADADCVDQALTRMAEEITAALGHSNPLVYVVMNGGLVLAGRLLPLLPFPLEVDYLHASRLMGSGPTAALSIWSIDSVLKKRPDLPGEMASRAFLGLSGHRGGFAAPV